MPYLIGTPEDWFRVNRRDLYLIRPTKKVRSKKAWLTAQKELHAWFADNLVGTSFGLLGPSEYSGWIEGGPGYITADLDSSGIAVFNAAWKKGSFWKIEAWLFSDWLKHVESANLLSSPVSETQKRVRWWDTPKGILMLNATTMGPFVDVEPGEHTLSLRDGWWRIQQLFPEFSGLMADTYPCGYFWRIEDEKTSSLLMIEYVSMGFSRTFENPIWDANEYASDTQKIQRLKNTIGISDESPLRIIVGDF